MTGQPRTVRALFVTPCFSSGGAERWVISTAQALAQAPGTEVAGFYSMRPDSMFEHEARAIAPVLYDWREAIAQLRPTVCVVWGLATSVIDFGEATRQGIPVVSVSHGGKDLAYSRRLAEDFSGVASHLAAVSETAALAYPASMRQFVTVLYNGADFNRCAPVEGREATRTKLRIRPDQRCVLYLARLSAEKRPGLLLDAHQYLPPNYVTVFCGALQDSRLEIRQQTRVRVLSPVSHVGDLLAAADCYVLPSTTEAFSIGLLEALFCRIPAVFCRHDAGKEMRKLFGHANFFSPTVYVSPQEFARHIVDAVTRTTPAMRDEMAQRVFREYSLARSGARWVDYLHRVVRRQAVHNPNVAVVEPAP